MKLGPTSQVLLCQSGIFYVNIRFGRCTEDIKYLLTNSLIYTCLNTEVNILVFICYIFSLA